MRLTLLAISLVLVFGQLSLNQSNLRLLFTQTQLMGIFNQTVWGAMNRLIEARNLANRGSSNELNFQQELKTELSSIMSCLERNIGISNLVNSVVTRFENYPYIDVIFDYSKINFQSAAGDISSILKNLLGFAQTCLNQGKNYISQFVSFEIAMASPERITSKMVGLLQYTTWMNGRLYYLAINNFNDDFLTVGYYLMDIYLKAMPIYHDIQPLSAYNYFRDAWISAMNTLIAARKLKYKDASEPDIEASIMGDFYSSLGCLSQATQTQALAEFMTFVKNRYGNYADINFDLSTAITDTLFTDEIVARYNDFYRIISSCLHSTTYMESFMNSLTDLNSSSLQSKLVTFTLSNSTYNSMFDKLQGAYNINNYTSLGSYLVTLYLYVYPLKSYFRPIQPINIITTPNYALSMEQPQINSIPISFEVQVNENTPKIVKAHIEGTLYSNSNVPIQQFEKDIEIAP